MADLRRDIFLGEIRDFSRLLDYALLWLHEQDIIRLNKGLAIFRSAMTIQLEPEKRNFGKEDYAALQMHYNEQVLQIHIMAEYVQRGWRLSVMRSVCPWIISVYHGMSLLTAGCPIVSRIWNDRRRLNLGKRLLNHSTIPFSSELLRMKGSKPMCLCLPAPVLEKHEYWSIVLHG